MNIEIVSKAVGNFSGAIGLACSMVILLKPKKTINLNPEEVNEKRNE